MPSQPMSKPEQANIFIGGEVGRSWQYCNVKPIHEQAGSSKNNYKWGSGPSRLQHMSKPEQAKIIIGGEGG